MSDEVIREQADVLPPPPTEDEPSPPPLQGGPSEAPADAAPAEDEPAEKPWQGVTEEEWKTLKAESAGRLKDLRHYRDEYKKATGIITQRLDQLNQAMAAQPQPQQEPEPDPEVDPIAHYQWSRKQDQAKLEKIEQAVVGNADRVAADRQLEEVNTWLDRSQREFVEQSGVGKDTYNQIVQAVKADRKKEYIAAGHDELTAEDLVNSEEQALILQSHARGQNPAETIFNIAKHRGLVPGGQPSTGSQPPAPAASPAQDVVERAAAGQAASRPDGGARTGSHQLTMEQLARMNPQEFDEYRAALKKKGSKIPGVKNLWDEVTMGGTVTY